MAKHGRGTGRSGNGSNYEVGYGRPPVHSRFNLGKSGNPKARPKGRFNARTTVEKVCNRQVTVREGDRKRQVGSFEALTLSTMSHALQGKDKARADVFGLVKSVGLAQEIPEQSIVEPVTANDAEIVADFLRRNGAPTENGGESEAVKDNAQNRLIGKDGKR